MTELQQKRNSRRDILILLIAVILIALVYNVVVWSGSGSAKFEDLVKAGNDLMDKQDFEQAILQYQKALAADSLHPEIMVDLGACYHAVGMNDEATQQFRRALSLDPKQPIALFNMGVVSLTVGDTAATKAWWGKYLEVSGDGPEAATVREQLQKM
jgi:tetratricopeptide (TPR) repeat protein